MSCLLEKIEYSEYQKAKSLPLEVCEIIFRLAKLDFRFDTRKSPGEQLINKLNNIGLKRCSVNQYREYIEIAKSTKIIHTYYKPVSKVAILIANEIYSHLSKLRTAEKDSEALGDYLRKLGFIVVIIKNVRSKDLTSILENLFEEIPENSYCFIYYAGHGCEICNTKFLLTVDCPKENIGPEHCVTENHILNLAASCKPDLCVLGLDMCRKELDRQENPNIYNSLFTVPPISIHNNLLVSYSTLPTQSAVELIQVNSTISVSNSIKTGMTSRINPLCSQYMEALCTTLDQDLDVSTMLDRAHAALAESSYRQQTPLKLQCGSCGTDKRSLYDPVQGDNEQLYNKLKEVETVVKETTNYEHFDITVTQAGEPSMIILVD